VIPFAPHAHRLAELHRQDSLQVEWDQLPILATEAWSWRDPESVAAVEACVTRLKDFVLEEWGCRPAGRGEIRAEEPAAEDDCSPYLQGVDARRGQAHVVATRPRSVS
jgi:hypothetical protein